VTGSGEDELLDVLEEAIAAAVLAESADRPGLFRFAHALVNYTLYERLGPTRRARLHRRVAEALERICADDPGPRLGELAHHRANAGTGGEKAVEYACRAGARALDELAPDEALRWFARAEELSRGGGEPGTRADILIGVGEAQRQVGDSAYRETLLEACRVASALGDGDRLARAALANNRGFASSYGEVDDERVAALDAALAAVGDRDPARRARLLSLLALELNFSGDLDRRLAAVDEAIAVARRAGDARALAYVLEHSMSAAWIPEMAEKRRQWALELVALADRLDDPALRGLAMIADGSTALETAEGERSERALSRARALADELGQPALRWSAMHYHGARLALSGRLDEAEAVAQAAAQVGLDSGQPDAFMMYGAQISLLRAWQGRGDEIIELLKQAADDNPGLPAFRAGVANVLGLLGCAEEARPMVELALEQRFEMPRDQVWLSAVAIWAEAAADAGVRAAAPRLYELLEPYADLVVWAGGIAYGSAAYYLARLADLLGDHAAADNHFSRSIEVNESLCSPPCIARTEARWGEALLRRGDRARATSLLERAAKRAGACGAGVFERRARELLGAAV